MEYLSNLIDIINDYIANEEISLNAFSIRVGVSGNALVNWTKMKYFPTIEYSIKIANYFNCSLDYLFGLSEFQNNDIESPNASFLETLNSLLRDHHMTLYSLSKVTGITQSSMSKWRNGNIPKTETIITLAKYFNVSMDYLVGRFNS